MTGGGALIEREAEIEAIDGALDAAVAGSGQTLVIEADAGMGKSSLLGAAAEMAARKQVLVLRAEGTVHEQALPFGGALQMFEPVIRGVGPTVRAALLGGPAELAAGLLTGTALPVVSDNQLALSIIHGLYWLTVNLCLPQAGSDGVDAPGRRPTVILVDDAHLLDGGTAGFVLYLGRRLADMPLSMVVAMRPATPTSPAELGSLRATAATRLHPTNLSSTAVTRLLSERFGETADPLLASSCAAVTDGNPFLLCALVDELRLTGIPPTAAAAERVRRLVPDSVLKATMLRLVMLGERATSVARLVAVIGEAADAPLMARILQLDVADASRAIEDLRNAGIFARQEPVRFSHALISSAVESDLSGHWRSALESKAARALAERGASDGRIASHLLGAAPAADAWAVGVLERAALDARRQGDASLAVRLVRRALEEPPTHRDLARLLSTLAEMEAAAGSAEALPHLDDALGLIEDKNNKAALLGRMGRILWAVGNHADSADCFSRGLAEISDKTGPEARELKARGAVAAHQSGKSLGDLELVLAELDLSAPSGDLPGERMVMALRAAQQALLGASRVDIDGFLDRAFPAGAASGSLLTEGGMMLTVASVAFLHADRLDELMALADESALQARRDGSVTALATASYIRTWAGYFRGSLGDARADAEFALNARSDGWGMQVGAACAVLAHARVEAGDIEGAGAALAEADSSELPVQAAEHSLLLVARGHFKMAVSDYAAALCHLLEAGRRDDALGVKARPIAWRCLASEAALALGDLDLARQIAQDELARAEAIGTPRTLGMALRTAGLAEGGDAGLRFVERAVDQLESSPSKLELARGLIDHGTLMRRAGRPKASRAPLARGLEMARSFGAATLAERALKELVLAGARPRRLAVTGPASLTPAERRVADLAVGGASNREIAQMLFVSIKAVEYHMSNVLKKLAITSRHQLAGALHNG